MKRSILVSFFILLLVVIIGLALSSQRAARPMQLKLNFLPVVGGQPLVLDEPRYANPAGEGRFKIRSFQFFISNIRLIGKSGQYVEPESYHLVRFDSASGKYLITLDNVPRQKYQKIEFGIGVDAAANGAITVSGDLDPNGRMAWSWDVGYKFVLFEGGLMLGGTQYPLVYHVGFDENFKTISESLDGELFEQQAPSLDFRVDILRMFDAVNRIDMSVLSNVKFDRKDAKRLAENFAHMVTLCPMGCSPLEGIK